MTSSRDKATSFFDKMLARFGEWRMEQVSRSWCLASPAERQHRLATVMALSVELARIKKTSIYATRLAENVIEDVIEGDWTTAAVFVEDFSFKKDSEVEAHIIALWEPFIIVLRAACAEESHVERGERVEPS
jgi:hypothetical protein